jgi:hypothetical protein
MRRVRLRNLVVGVLAAMATLGSAGIAADAASASKCVGGGCDLFQYGPDNGYFFTTPGGATVGMICWEDSAWYDGTNRWFYISTIFGTGRAWVSANQVTQQARVGHC